MRASSNFTTKSANRGLGVAIVSAFIFDYVMPVIFVIDP